MARESARTQPRAYTALCPVSYALCIGHWDCTQGHPKSRPNFVCVVALSLSYALQVLYNELPIYVTPELADTVAFVGRAVRMLKTRAAGFTGQDLLPFK